MRRKTGMIYRIHVHEAAVPEPHVWEGQATNITDAFTQARTWVDPHRWKGVMQTFLVERRDHEA